MNTLIQRLGFWSIALLLSACAATRTEPGGDVVALVRAAGATSEALPEKAAAYQAEIRDICQEIQRLRPEAAFAQLRSAGILVSLPEVSLPLRDFDAVEETAHSPATVGVPVVLGYATEKSPLYPPEGLFIDATVIVRKAKGRVSLEISTSRRTVHIGGRSYPLAINPSAAAWHLTRSARKLAGSGFASMIRPASMARKPQVYLLDPYDPEKIPLLMVHGLQSTPVAFAAMVCALRSDPMVRERYQIWQFYYPSGSPVLANAADLRDSLMKTLRKLDPSGRAVRDRGIVVVGHSMGGVISHTLVSDSGDALWSSVFLQPPKRLQGDAEAIRSLTRILKFERDPHVGRVIFMAAPHRGSPMADSFVGWTGNFLARLSPMEEKGFSHLARENPQAVAPAAARFYAAGRFSAVRTLSPKSTALIALAGRPISVPYHSVIGQQKPGPKERGSDGVVPYGSSHLEGAKSEFIVRSGHGVIGNPDGIREVLRILHEDERERLRGTP